jgi:hypothetical protein
MFLIDLRNPSAQLKQTYTQGRTFGNVTVAISKFQSKPVAISRLTLEMLEPKRVPFHFKF